MSSRHRGSPGTGHVGSLLSARCTACGKTANKRTAEVVGDLSNGSFQHVCHSCRLVTWWNVLSVLEETESLRGDE